MKTVLYKVQMDFVGNKIPTVSQTFLGLKEAKEFYDKQKVREDCSFCNLVKIEAKVLDGTECEKYEDNFRFCI